MIPSVWNNDNYLEFIDYLKSVKEDKYREFHSSLVLNCKYEFLGIRLPIMRKIAKEISKGDIYGFLDSSLDNYYEEVMIQGLVISYIKDEKIFYKYFKNYIKKIDNWALCDTFCNSIKITKKYPDKYFNEAIKLCNSNKEFIIRVGLIMILSNFVEENYVDEIISTIDSISSDKYYVNMGQAWLLCELFIKYPDKTMVYLKNNNLNRFTHNKTISKIHDSYRVDIKTKEYLNTLRK